MKITFPFISLHFAGSLLACAATPAAPPRIPSTDKIAESSSCVAREVTLKIAARVEDRPLVEGTVQPTCARVWVVVHPLSVSEFWVQAMPTVRTDGAWVLKPHIGREGEHQGEQFEVAAIANPTEELKEGLVLTRWPSGEARSDVSLVTKVVSFSGAAETTIATPAAAPAVVPTPPSKNGTCQLLAGDAGVDKKYASGWLDLSGLTTFHSGSSLRLTIGGTAKKILVRLLPSGKSPDQKVGVLGVYAVPKDRILTVPIVNTLSDIVQISVHGGPQAWDVRLGPGNGAATLEQVEVCQ
jgi:hypothetical protein